MDHFFSQYYSTDVLKSSRSWAQNWQSYSHSRVSQNLEIWRFLLQNLKLLPRYKIFRKKLLESNCERKHILFICEKKFPILKKKLTFTKVQKRAKKWNFPKYALWHIIEKHFKHRIEILCWKWVLNNIKQQCCSILRHML